MAIKRIYPDKVTGYELNPIKGFFAIVVPVESINSCANPSLEHNDDNWSGYSSGGATLNVARVSTEQRRGAYSFEVTPSSPGKRWEGARFEAAPTIVGDDIYTYSFDFKGRIGITYGCWAATHASPTPANALGAIKYFTSNGHWQRFYNNYTQAGAADIIIAEMAGPDGLSGEAFYVDGLSIENLAYPTTYFDGDSKGLVTGREDFIWFGLPHASNSWRSGESRAGGRIIYLKDIGFDVLSYMGLGKSTDNHVLTSLGLVGGSYYQRSIPNMREYVLAGAIAKDSYFDMKLAMAQLSEYFSREESVEDQPTVVYLQDVDDCGNAIGDPLHLPSLYMSGLEEDIDNLYQEKFAISLTMPQPDLLVDGENGEEIDQIEDSDASAYCAMQRYLDNDTDPHLWRNMDNGLDDYINTICEAENGLIYFGGEFANVRPATTANYIAYWYPTGSAWGVINVGVGLFGLNDAVNQIIPGKEDTVYICGMFDDVDGGVGGTYEKIVAFNSETDTFSALGAGLPGALADAQCFDIAIDPTTGYLWAVHTYDSGASLRGRVSYWNGSSWNTSISVGPEIFFYTISISADGVIYVGGEQVGNNGLVEYTVDKGATWNTLTAFDGPVYDSVFGDDGVLYLCGMFTIDVYGNDTKGVCAYDGYNQFFALGDGLEDTGTYNSAGNLYYRNGLLYVTGAIKWIADGAGGLNSQTLRFDTTGGFKHNGSYAMWNGSSWLLPDIAVDWSTGVIGAFDAFTTSPAIFDRQGNQYVGVKKTAGTFPTGLTYSRLIEVENTGSSNTFPIIELIGDYTATPTMFCYLTCIRNETTDETIHISQQNIGDGETIIIDLENKTIVSNINGNIINCVLPGSDFSKFHLKPGTNRLTIYGIGAAASYVAGRIWWRIRHNYSGGALYR